MFNQLKRLNAADWISSLRLIAVPIVIITTLLDLKEATGWIILIGLATDAVDGQVARRFHLTSKIGSRLDSIGDASLFLASFFSIVWFFPEFITTHLWQVCVLMGLYFLQLVVSFIKHKRETSFHTYAAKLSAITESLFIVVCFFYQPVEWLFYVTWIIGLLEQIDELSLLFILPELKEDVKGIYWILKEKK
jgi:CDP-diacylglycerol--glycerol-3-phosphate 3-phosphatidyltransferase